ncbi:hypothetical protein [Waddlia chondrophila]|uniref:Secreted protein n=2 Tax=Waddlia chondrophila TaxID=71667 RepID=D6YVS5_WADCW|nr:hypothetical protein [Waddlia chondrophila]ADI38236.1 hypothetical protein wcw_0870 [Waddlia chondrophila WSU 86-1044]
MKFEIVTKWMLGFALMSAPLMASDEEPEEHIQVGSRALGHAERVLIQEQKYELIRKLENGDELTEEESECVLAEEEAEDGEVKSKLIKKSAGTSTTYYTSHEGATHHPIAVSLMGDTVQLEDGSIWIVSSEDRYQTFDWMTGDTIVIVPNHTWFSSYNYCLVNLNTGAKVKVNLSLGPIYNGIYTHWILAIDYSNREVYLEDGSVWKMSWWDSSIVNQWLPNDTVIIGINDGWFSGSNPNMLINVNMNDHAIGNCIF